MSRGKSGRIVIEVDPKEKHRLYEALAREGITLKNWFLRVANDYCEQQVQPRLFTKEQLKGARAAK